jgi:hypothetical protein
MTLPASFLAHVERHSCFTGCFNGDATVSVCLDPAQPLAPLIVVSCADCFARLGVPASLLPSGTSGSSLATYLTGHLRQRRGFALTRAGYHTHGPGFWLSVAYYPCGLFLINGERSRQLGSDLDLLLLAFRHNLVTPPDARMLDARHYNIETVYVHYGSAPSPVCDKTSLLASGCCRMQPQLGWHRVTLAEFLPLSTRSAAPAKPLRLGDVCPKCGAVVRERALLNGTFVGCLC